MTDFWKRLEGHSVGGEFELRKFLGGSATSGVFTTERDRQKAAIKLVPVDPKRAEAQLARIARAASASHRNLLPLYESGCCKIGDTDFVYVVMEFADENLSEILPQRALTPAEAGEMLPAILDALSYLHSRNLAHGRIKPSNILAIGDRVKISSDGICAHGDAPSRPTDYDAPEVTTSGCSAAADVWALGSTLVETLTQQRAQCSPGDQGEPVLPQSLPQPFFDIARNCLLRDPKLRWNVAAIAWRLRPTWSAPQVQASHAPQSQLSEKQAGPVGGAARVERAHPRMKWRHLAPAAALMLLAAIVILVVPKVLNRAHGPSAQVAAVGSAAEAVDHTDRKAAVKHTAAKTSSAAANAGAAAFAPGEVAHQVLPNVPQPALDTIRGTVKVGVRVRVGPSGDVTAASLESPGPSRYFANLALSAAREWKFSPAPSDAESIGREWMLRFEFTPEGIRAFPSRAQP